MINDDVLEALLSGDCWMACATPVNVPRIYVGVASSDGSNLPLYSCLACTHLHLKRILHEPDQDVCWLWCGRADVETVQIGSIEVFPFAADLRACGVCIPLLLQAIHQAVFERDSAGYRADCSRQPILTTGERRVAMTSRRAPPVGSPDISTWQRSLAPSPLNSPGRTA